MKITRRIFESQRQRRFGTRNPERMDLPFWEWMVRGSEEARLRDWPAEHDPSVLGHTPCAARSYFGLEGDDSQGPIWNFDRMGATRTPHPDGRVICIGGEHEDFYDPDFCIYNDVVVLDLDGSIAIYGYPEDVFPPTDFHTATLAGDRVIVIGRTGYADARLPGTTPVLALDLATYRFEPLPSHGELPGWIFDHEAELSLSTITIRGGEIQAGKGREITMRRNFDDFSYDLATGAWTRLTDRRWKQFSIRNESGKPFTMGPPFRGCCPPDAEPWNCEPLDQLVDMADLFIHVMPEALLPRRLAYETVWTDGPSLDTRILVTGIPVSIAMEASSIEVIIEGDMDPALANDLAQDIKDGIEADTGQPCTLHRLS